MNGRDYDRLVARSGFEKVFSTKLRDIDFFSKFLMQFASNITANSAVILVNQSMSSTIPGSFSVLFEQLEYARNFFPLEISEGCSGFVKALIVGDSLLQSEVAEEVFIICAEKYSDYFDRSNDSIGPIFSDAISITKIERDEKFSIVAHSVSNDFAAKNSICVNEGKLFMDGGNVLAWVLTNVEIQVSELLTSKNILATEVVGWHIHQASRIVVESLAERLGIAPSDLFTSKDVGNTVSSSLPIHLENLFSGDFDAMALGYHVMVGFGVGLTSVVCIFEVKN